MEQKNRLVFTIAVVLLILAALLISFGRSLFRLETPDVALPSVDASQPGSSAEPDGNPTGSGQLVAVTPQTVQSVIATLERSDSYYRELTVEQIWASGSSSSTVQTWVDQEWSNVRQLLPSGVVRQDLVGPDRVYYWYEGSSRYESAPADERSADLAQRLPTYETVLELDTNSITAAGYESMGEMPCVYVEATDEASANVKRYWVSVDSGLLVCAELLREEQVIYRMTAFGSIQSPCPASASFQLPDGTVLHTP